MVNYLNILWFYELNLPFFYGCLESSNYYNVFGNLTFKEIEH